MNQNSKGGNAQNSNIHSTSAWARRPPAMTYVNDPSQGHTQAQVLATAGGSTVDVNRKINSGSARARSPPTAGLSSPNNPSQPSLSTPAQAPTVSQPFGASRTSRAPAKQSESAHRSISQGSQSWRPSPTPGRSLQAPPTALNNPVSFSNNIATPFPLKAAAAVQFGSIDDSNTVISKPPAPPLAIVDLKQMDSFYSQTPGPSSAASIPTPQSHQQQWQTLQPLPHLLQPSNRSPLSAPNSYEPPPAPTSSNGSPPPAPTFIVPPNAPTSYGPTYDPEASWSPPPPTVMVPPKPPRTVAAAPKPPAVNKLPPISLYRKQVVIKNAAGEVVDLADLSRKARSKQEDGPAVSVKEYRRPVSVRLETEDRRKKRMEEERLEDQRKRKKDEELAKIKAKRDAEARERAKRDQEEKERRQREQEKAESKELAEKEREERAKRAAEEAEKERVKRDQEEKERRRKELEEKGRVKRAAEEAEKERVKREEEEAEVELKVKRLAEVVEAELEAERLAKEARQIAGVHQKAQEEGKPPLMETTVAVAAPSLAGDRLAGNTLIGEDMSSNATAAHQPSASSQSLPPLNQLGEAMDGHPRVDATSLQHSYEVLSQSARNFFHFISAFHHSGILVAVLTTAATNDFKDRFQLTPRPREHATVVKGLEELLRTDRKWNELEVQRSINTLQSFSLISVISKDSHVLIQVDPLVQGWCRDKDLLASRHYQSMALQVITSCSGKGASLLHRHLVPHIIGIINQIKTEDLHLNDAVAAGSILEAQEHHQRAEELFRAARKLMTKATMQNNQATSTVHQWLGIPSIDQGRRCEPEALQIEYLEAMGLGAMSFSPDRSTVAATAYIVLQSAHGLHKIALLCIKHLDEASNPSTTKIKLDSDPCWTRLAYHPTGKYICSGEHAWDLALEPLTRVPEHALSGILQETFQHGPTGLPTTSPGPDTNQILHVSPGENVLVYTADNGLLALATHNSQVTVLNVEHVLTIEEIALINHVRDIEHPRNSGSNADSGKETQDLRNSPQ